MDMGISGKTALITGAARGIGLAEATALAAEGVNIAICDLDIAAAQEAASDLSARYGVKAHGYEADATNEEAVKALFEAVLKEFGTLHILINNAGVAGKWVGKTIENMDFESWDFMMRAHLDSTFLCTRAAIPMMRAAGFGRIVNTSSMNVVGGGRPGNANYTTAKAGIHGFTRVVAKEVGDMGITCNCLAPGYVETALIAYFSEEARNIITSQNPVGRFCQPEEVAAAVVYLCSPQAAFVNGAMLNIDGGRREFHWG